MDASHRAGLLATWALKLAALLSTPAGAACGHEAPGTPSTGDPEAQLDRKRELMVERDIAARGVRDSRVLDVMRRTPRHLFVPESHVDEAYDDTPLPIGHGQTISQPYIVALMTELARPEPGDRALEVGTGSGYQAAVLAPLVKELCTIEIVEELAREAERRLQSLGHENVAVRAGDGYGGWPERAPFDIIIVTAAPPEVPPPLLDQLAPGGRLVIPVGPVSWMQELKLIEKGADGALRTTSIAPVAFVPLQRAD